MKAGVRALGVAESYRDRESTLAAAVVRADRTVDGFALGSCTVGGTDATDAVGETVRRLGRDDARYLFVSGVAPAWFNVLDLHVLGDAVQRPVLSVSFERSPGLAEAIREHFHGEAATRRLATYHAQPDRRAVEVNGETVFVRAVGIEADEAEAVVQGFTPEGGRPEPLRVARLVARAGDEARRAWAADGGDTNAADG